MRHGCSNTPRPRLQVFAAQHAILGAHAFIATFPRTGCIKHTERGSAHTKNGRESAQRRCGVGGACWICPLDSRRRSAGADAGGGKGGAVGGEGSSSDGGAGGGKEGGIVDGVVGGEEDVGQHLVRVEQVVDVAPRVPPAREAPAALLRPAPSQRSRLAGRAAAVRREDLGARAFAAVRVTAIRVTEPAAGFRSDCRKPTPVRVTAVRVTVR